MKILKSTSYGFSLFSFLYRKEKLMKKLILSLMTIGCVCWFTFAYQPTSSDVAVITGLQRQFDTLSSGNMQLKWDFYIQLKSLQEQFSGHEKLEYYLNTMSTYLVTQVNTEKVKAKVASKTTKQLFVDQYSGGFSQDITTADTCTGRYNTLDTISFANNFPTALTMATRYRETNCGYYMPSNGDGPFQIVSKDYGTGQITEAKFLRTIQDFIKFSKAKHTQYKTKLWISLTYTGFDMTGLVNHAGLYNGGLISWEMATWNIVVPNNPHYLYDGYGSEYSGATRYWLIPKFLKSLDWELKTNY